MPLMMTAITQALARRLVFWCSWGTLMFQSDEWTNKVLGCQILLSVLSVPSRAPLAGDNKGSWHWLATCWESLILMILRTAPC